MNCDFIYRQITKLYDYWMVNHPWNGNIHDSSQKNDDHNRMDSSRFHVVEIHPKGKPLNATHYIEHILQQILKCVRNLFGIVSSFMQTMPDLIQPGSLKNFVNKISENRISSNILSWFCTFILRSIRIYDALSDRTFLSFGKCTSWCNSHYFQKSLWRPHSGTGWIDWFESLHTKVITIHKVNPGLFIYLFIIIYSFVYFFLFDFVQQQKC
jgi:hypothetical protein